MKPKNFTGKSYGKRNSWRHIWRKSAALFPSGICFFCTRIYFSLLNRAWAGSPLYLGDVKSWDAVGFANCQQPFLIPILPYLPPACHHGAQWKKEHPEIKITPVPGESLQSTCALHQSLMSPELYQSGWERDTDIYNHHVALDVIDNQWASVSEHMKNTF